MTQNLLNIKLGVMQIRDNELLTPLEDAVVHINDTKCTRNKLAGSIMFFSTPLGIADKEFGDQVDLNEDFITSAEQIILELKHLWREEKMRMNPRRKANIGRGLANSCQTNRS